MTDDELFEKIEHGTDMELVYMEIEQRLKQKYAQVSEMKRCIFLLLELVKHLNRVLANHTSHLEIRK